MTFRLCFRAGPTRGTPRRIPVSRLRRERASPDGGQAPTGRALIGFVLSHFCIDLLIPFDFLASFLKKICARRRMLVRNCPHTLYSLVKRNIPTSLFRTLPANRPRDAARCHISICLLINNIPASFVRALRPPVGRATASAPPPEPGTRSRPTGAAPLRSFRAGGTTSDRGDLGSCSCARHQGDSGLRPAGTVTGPSGPLECAQHTPSGSACQGAFRGP
jgi:hypothetical protein